MKLTWRLSVAVSLGVLVLLTLHAVVRVERDVARFRDAVAADHRNLALAVLAAVSQAGPATQGRAVRAMVEQIDRGEPDLSIRWVRLDFDVEGAERPRFPPTAPHRAGAIDRATFPGDGVDTMVSHLVVALPGMPLTAIEIVQPLTRQREYEHEAVVRTATTTGLVVLACIGLILGFGVLFVGRPLQALRLQAARIARGERGARTLVRSRDEIGELAQEMNRMACAIEEATDRATREEAARIEAFAQLRHADRLRAVGELASSIAHDLGAPMNAVNARAHMIAEGEVAYPRAREMAARIVEEIGRMSRSLRRLLDHGRRERPTRVKTSLLAVVVNVTELIEPVARARGVRLATSGDAIHVEVDEGQFRHVVLNLVSNAIDAAPSGSEVHVHVVRDGSDALVRVSDRGPGIAVEDRSRIFEPFFTTKGEGAGTGLGLSIAQTIVIEHGGRITLADGDESQTVFEIRLPAA